MTKLDQSLLSNRYGEPFVLPSDILENCNDTITTILSHKSIRSYDNRPLEPGLLELLVAASESASTSSNLHTYSIIAVENAQRKEELSQICGHQQQIIDAPLFLVFCADLARLKTVCEKEVGPSAALDYTEMFIMAVIDATLAAQNLTIAAESLGLGTCYIGGARNHPAQISEFLGLPDKVFATFGLTVGYPLSRSEDVKPRLPQHGGILHRERYDNDYADALMRYEEIMKKFNGHQAGREGRGWLAPTAHRVATPESLGAERPTIKQFLEKVGLDLL